MPVNIQVIVVPNNLARSLSLTPRHNPGFGFPVFARRFHVPGFAVASFHVPRLDVAHLGSARFSAAPFPIVSANAAPVCSEHRGGESQAAGD